MVEIRFWVNIFFDVSVTPFRMHPVRGAKLGRTYAFTKSTTPQKKFAKYVNL